MDNATPQQPRPTAGPAPIAAAPASRWHKLSFRLLLYAIIAAVLAAGTALIALPNLSNDCVIVKRSGLPLTVTKKAETVQYCYKDGKTFRINYRTPLIPAARALVNINIDQGECAKYDASIVYGECLWDDQMSQLYEEGGYRFNVIHFVGNVAIYFVVLVAVDFLFLRKRFAAKSLPSGHHV